MAERKRIGVPISGIDTSTPDHSVTDGKCAELHNLRYTGGAWRSVKEFSSQVGEIDGYEIIYKHLASPDNEYIVKQDNASANESIDLYAYSYEDDLYYTTALLSDDTVLNTSIYDSSMKRVGAIHNINPDGSIDINFATTPNPFIIEGYNIYTPIPGGATELYFAEREPKIGSIAMVYGINGVPGFSYYGKVVDRNDREIFLTNVQEQDADSNYTYSFELRDTISLDLLRTCPAMWRITNNEEVAFYTISSNIGSLIDTLAYVETDGVMRLAQISNVDSSSAVSTLYYRIMDDYFGGTHKITYVQSMHTKEEVRWLDTWYMERRASADKIDENSYRPIYSATINHDKVQLNQEICKVWGEVAISHFGNMLLVHMVDGKKTLYLLRDNNGYRQYNLNPAFSFSMTESLSLPSSAVKWVKSETDIGNQTFYTINTWETVAPLNNNELLFTSTENELFRGEFAIFAVLRSQAGAILYKTPIQIYNPTDLGSINIGNGNIDYISNAYGEISKDKRGVIGTATLTKAEYDRVDEEFAKGFAPEPSKMKKVLVSFDCKAFNDDVYDIAFFATRLYNLFTVSQFSIDTNDIDLLQEPFYLLKTFSINEIKLGDISSFEIDSRLIQTIEENPLFEAIQSTNVYSSRTFEYNNRLHLLDVWVNTSDVPRGTLKTDDTFAENDIFRRNIILHRTYDSKSHYHSIPSSAFKTPENISISYSLKQDKVISLAGHYTKLYICGDNKEYSNEFDLLYSPTLDVSYFTKRKSTSIGKHQKYEPIVLGTSKVGVLDVDVDNNAFLVPNRLQVSEVNDPYTFPYNTSYRIGSATNEIITANSAAIEMSDAKFGEFPLYVFTKEGIFAMQSGTETLYSAIIPINYDVAINPNTLAVNGAVLYFTDKGLHALSKQGTVLLSEPIHTADNRIPDWMYTSQMIYLPEWNEVLCTDLANKKAYVFSLDNKAWSTRDIPSGYILNNDELVSEGDSKIYNLRNEKETMTSPISCKVVTRPIKLGSMELKRAETMIVRFECSSEQDLIVKIEGSINGETDDASWHTLREITTDTNKDIVIRRTPFSVKYLRFTIEGDFNDDIRILAFELEYYNRMRHRMR